MELTKGQLDTLSKLGLSEIQIQLYLISLKHGLLSVLELSRLTKLSRQKIYEEAERLIDLGLYEVTRRQGRKYIPAHPSKLLTLGQSQINVLQDIIGDVAKLVPVLESGEVSKKNEVKIKYYEGMGRVKRAFEDELAACHKTEVIFAAGSIEDVYKFFPEKYWAKWNRQFVKQGSRSRMLVHDSPAARQTAKLDSGYNRDTRFLKKFPLKVNIDVFNNTVLIVSYYDEFAVWLESKILANSYRIMFNTLWEIADQK